MNNRLRKVLKDVRPLFENNKEAIKAYNKELIPRVFIISLLTLLVPIINGLIRHEYLSTLPIYVTPFFLICLLSGLFHIKKLNKYPLLFIYVFGLVIFGIVIYSSIINNANKTASFALTFFVLVPLIFVDRSYRMNLYATIMFLVHAILSFVNKEPNLALSDFINTTISTMTGILFGRLFLITRLNAFEMERLLIIEKESDYLTGLYNRRKLFADLNVYDKKGIDVSLLMCDLDFFKEYNDKYGHVNGDIILTIFGQLLLDIEKEHPVMFYRYGGEEFVCVVMNLTSSEVISLTERIIKETGMLSAPYEKFTVSVGVATAEQGRGISKSDLLDKADNALYRAKKAGRNRHELAD